MNRRKGRFLKREEEKLNNQNLNMENEYGMNQLSSAQEL
jgi:hypothetical protein